MQADVAQRRLIGARGVAEGHVFEPDVTFGRRGQRPGADRVVHGVRRAQKFHQPLRRPGGALQFAPDFRKCGDRPGRHHGIDDELHQLARAHRAAAHVARADPENANDPAEDKEDDDDRHHRPRADAPLGRQVGLLRHLGEIAARLALMGEGLHGLDRAQRLGRGARGLRDPVLILAAQHPQAATLRDNRHNYRRDDQEDQKRQLRCGDEQHHQPAQQDQHIAQRDRDGRADDRQDQRRVGGDAADNLAGQDLFVEGRAHPDHTVEDGLADVGHDPLAQPGDKVVACAGAQREQRRDHQRPGEIAVQERRALAEPVDHAPHRQRQEERDRSRQHQREARHHDHPAIGREEWPEPAERADPAGPRAVFGNGNG